MRPISIISFFILISAIFISCHKERGYRIGVSQCSEDDWRRLMNDQMEREVMFHPEVKLEIRSAADSNERQISDIRYFIDNNFDIIIVAPNEAEALTPVIEEAHDRGIPVLVFDRSIRGHKYTAFQGADNASIGKKAAQYASGLLPAGGKILEIEGRMASTPAAERSRGFREALDSIGGGMRIIADADANWNYDDALVVADSLLALHPEIDLIFAHNDRMAMAAADMADKRGLSPYIIGVDAAPEIGMKAVADGKIDATFLYPSEGHQLILTALDILDGREFEREVHLPISPAVDSSNIDILLRQNQTLENETGHLKLLKEEVDNYWNEHTSQTALLYTSIAVLLLVCIVLFLVLRAFWQHRRHQAELLLKNRLLQEQSDHEKELNRQLAEATQSKLTFFTNVSHDLRTPLTLIAEPLDQLEAEDHLSPKQQVWLKIAEKNVKILKRLINQILDFRKFENDRLDLNLEESNPALFAKEWVEAFRGLANKKHIDFTLYVDLPEGFTTAFDVEKIERVVFNLLFNAFKHTPVKGKITLCMGLTEEGKEIVIKVTDNGRGIPAENLKDIFERFYQIDKIRPEGSGIGLSLAKAFVELHGGSIGVESEESVKTVFTVILPVRHVDRKTLEETIRESGASAREVADLLDDSDEVEVVSIDEEDERPLVLIIDDNQDIRFMVKEILKDDYQVIGAENGKTGIRMAMRYVPDAIICDVMMPGIDGMETCATLKGEVSTSHIPVLMLTACAMDEQRAEGYQSGADGYMAKPFNSEVLRARLLSLIANRKRIKAASGALVPPVRKDRSDNGKEKGEKTTRTVAPDMEREFYARFLAILGENIGDMTLSVESLADMMGMGRSQFYRKLKALTGLAPAEILRDFRLKRARDLILSTDKTISEIAYEVGFSTPAYFTKCYREAYSETPTATREAIK